MGVTAPLFHKKTYILSSDATDAHFNARNLPHLLLHYLQDTIPYPKNIVSTPLPHSWGLQPPSFPKNPYILSSDATDAQFNGLNLQHLLLHYLQDTIPYPKNIAFTPLPHSWGLQPPFFTKIPYNLSSDATDAHFNARNLPHLLLHYLQDTIPYPKNIAFTPLPHSWGLQPPFFTKIPYNLSSDATDAHFNARNLPHLLLHYLQDTIPYPKNIAFTPLPHSRGLQPPFSQKFHIFSALTPLTLTLMLETCHIYYCIISRTQSPIQKILLSPHCLTHGGYSPPFSQKNIYSQLWRHWRSL